MIYINGEEVKPYLGDYKPLTIYKGTEKLAGWVENTISGIGNIQIENGYSTMKVKPFGKSEQTQTEQSANLCPNINSDKWVLSGGAYKENGYIVLPQSGARAEIVVEWNGQTANADGQYVIRTGAVFDTEDIVNAKYHINLEYLNANKEVLSGNGNADIIGGNDIWRKYGVVYSENDEHGAAIRDAKYITFTIQYSSQFNSAIFKFKNPLISKTSNDSYIPFVPDSPSPNYRSDIENVSGDLEIKVVGNNILDYKNGWSKIISYDENLDAIYTTSYTNRILISPENNNKHYLYFKVKKRKRGNEYPYNASWNLIKNGNVEKYNTGQDSEEFIELKYELEAGNKWEFLLYNRVYIKDMMLVVEETTTYEPYKEQVVTFPFAEGQKLMKDGYLASDGIHNKRKQVVLTGNENWQQINSNESSILFRMTVTLTDALSTLATNTTKLMCNYFNTYNCYAQNQIKNGVCYHDERRIMIRIEKSLLATQDVEGFKNWLAEKYNSGNPVIIEYLLAEKGTTPYTEEQATSKKQIDSLKTYRTVTNISNSQNTNMEIAYKNNT